MRLGDPQGLLELLLRDLLFKQPNLASISAHVENTMLLK